MKPDVQKEFIKNLTIEDLRTHHDLYMIAQEVGIEAVKPLLSFAGLQISIPKKWFSEVLEREVLSRWKSNKNAKWIAHELGTSESTVRNIIKENY